MSTVINTEISTCYHCGESCKDEELVFEEKAFCCEGCKLVFQLLQDNGLCNYYDLDSKPGLSLKGKKFGAKFAYLENDSIIAPLLDYSSTSLRKITLRIPSIHCSSCIWLLENLYRLQDGVISSRVNFFKKELAVSYDPATVSLRKIVELLATVGYSPDINLEDSDKKGKSRVNREIFVKLGVVGFCTGNIMLLSFPEYFGLEETIDSIYRSYFIWLNVLLSLPVFFYGGSEYFIPAYQSLKKKVINIDVPVSMGIITLFIRSLYESISGISPGYWDSLSGLVFFLLIGKWLQNKTYENFSFERNYKSYFPLAASILEDNKEKNVAVNDLAIGDIMAIRNQELIPADSELVSSEAWIDYSFVTGESEPVLKKAGDYIYAGGRQVGNRIELIIQKPVSQSYLTQLWNNEIFTKEKITPMTRLAADFSRYFTYATISLAILTAIFWYFVDITVMWNAFTAVLIIACPCALSLSMPFTMENTMRIFGKNGIYVKNPTVIQHLATINHIVFDKTGTLTEGGKSTVSESNSGITIEDRQLLKSLVSHSTHPLSRKLYHHFTDVAPLQVKNYRETPGAGIEGVIEGRRIKIGSKEFVKAKEITPLASDKGPTVFFSIDEIEQGYFQFSSPYRNNLNEVIENFKPNYEVSLLSGDHKIDLPVLLPLFEKEENMHFEQSPLDKLNYIKSIQQLHKNVLMIGDGLNDAGALKQSEVGMVLTDDVQSFFPSCDILMDAKKFNRLNDVIRFSKTSVNIVKASFLFSMIYNVIGLSWAISGNLSPVFAAILMPVSSISVVGFAVGLSSLFAHLRKF